MVNELLDKGLVTQAVVELKRKAANYPGEGFDDRIDSCTVYVPVYGGWIQ